MNYAMCTTYINAIHYSAKRWLLFLGVVFLTLAAIGATINFAISYRKPIQRTEAGVQ